MGFKDPYEYLRWKYLDLNSKKKEKISLNVYFEKAKAIYGNKQKELYESDQILFTKLEEMASHLDLPIEEQDENTYAILNRHASNVEKILKENNLSIPNKIVLGTLPTNDFNASVCPFPNGEMLVALNYGLIQFIYSFGRIISSIFSKKDNSSDKNKIIFDFNEKRIRENLKNNKEANSKFIEAFVLHFANRDLSLSNIRFEKDENIDLSGILWDNAELFVVAHEYSHIILEYNQVFSKRFSYDDSMLYEVIRSWNEESAADELALKIVLAHNKSEGNGFFAGYLGIELLFVCFDILEKSYNLEFSETHPLANVRILNLRKCLKDILPDQYETILDGSKIIEEIGLNLWSINKEIIYDLCNKL